MDKQTSNTPVVKPTAKIDQMSEVRQFSAKELDLLKIVYPGVDNSKLLKVFRELRTRINKYAEGRNYVCLVTSMVSDGGASYVSMNLASAISLDRTKTSLLIDCNLYAPAVDCLLAMDAQVGLTDLLDDADMGVEQIVYASGIPRLRVIPVGNNCDGGTEKITSARMKEFIGEVKERYADRFVIVDAPPVGDYDAEIRILADLCDFVVLVVPYGKVTDSQVQAAVSAIGKERLAGVVFNNS